MMLFFVYFMEYCVITGFAQVIRERQEKDMKEDKDIDNGNLVDTPNCYIIINTCYQIGVFISRSSFKWVQIP